VAVTQIQYYGTGRRKSAAARVFLRPGTGAININAQPLTDALTIETLRTVVKTPLLLTETQDKFDVIATTAGGGISGQAGAIRLGIARAVRLRHRAAAAPEEGRAPDAGPAHQGTQEVRHGRCAQALPVQQALNRKTLEEA
jgi:ribosomal protein S9